jgi:PKD repeat protein
MRAPRAAAAVTAALDDAVCRARLLGGVLAALGVLLVGPGTALATPPSASFSFDPANPLPGQLVQFTSSSYDPDGAGVVEAWDFDGNGSYEATGRVAQATFSQPGPHRVRVLVTDGWGESSTATQTVQVVAPPTPPKVAFSVSPSHPLTGEEVRFRSQASDPNHDIVLESWDLNGDGVFGDRTGPTVQGIFNSPGSYQVGLRVTDAAGHVTTGFRRVDVSPSSIPPRASFSASPSRPAPGQTVSLESRSSDRNDDIVEESWDLNGDGQYGDAVGRIAQTTFGAGGDYQVGLRVTDGDGHVEVETKTIKVVVGPVASFTFAPRTPITGEKVTFTSLARDGDGKIRRWRWDLDGDGKTDDGKKETATRTYDKPGSYTVALEVEDDDGSKATTFQTLQVYLPGTVPAPAPPLPPPPPVDGTRAGGGDAIPTPPPPPPPAPAARRLRALSPFPVVRIRGQILRRSTRIEVLSVSGPQGAKVQVRCRGRGCPRRVLRTKVRKARGAERIRQFERTLPAGVVLEITVTKGNRIGKYTKFVIRGRLAPVRRDLCVGPVSIRPVACPA